VDLLMKFEKSGRFRGAGPGLPLNAGLRRFEPGPQGVLAGYRRSGFLQHENEFPTFFS
jgi:hypothetical protein